MVQNTIQMLIVDGEEPAENKRNSADFVRLATGGSNGNDNVNFY